MVVMKNILFVLVLFSQLSFAQDDFVKVSGKHLTKGNNTIQLRGVCFGNEVWSDTEIPTNHHSELDYEKLKEMGLNTVRFYLNYRTFEDDDNPYNYKEDGWKWLDQNIKWAKRNNIHLILNMHIPQGGFQSLGDGVKLWENKNLQSRFVKLWKAIASRYADEPTIAGYDLLNEPGVTDSIGQWKSLAQRTVSSIRTVDKNHAIIIERVNSIAKSWVSTDENQNFFKLDDDNIIYTFHFYDPIEYTHQNTPWTGLGEGGKYPDKDINEFPSDLKWYSANFDNQKIDWGNNVLWKYYEGKPYKITDEFIKVAKPVLVANNNSGKVLFGSVTIKEYDPSGKYVRDIMSTEIAKLKGWNFWSKNGKGNFGTVFNYGVENKSAVYIENTSSDANCYNNSLRFIPKYGYMYTVSGWAKGEAIPPEAICMFRFDFETTASEIKDIGRTKEYLENQIKKYLAFQEKCSVPIYVGEFGLYKDCFDKRRGGVNWVSDVLEILTKYNISYTYHAWNEDAFGIYPRGLANEREANKKLLEVLYNKK